MSCFKAMSEGRFALSISRTGARRDVFASTKQGHTYSLPRAVAHAATRRVVAKQRPPHWTRPTIFRPPEVLTEVEVIEAEAELKALQRHALEVVDPETSV